MKPSTRFEPARATVATGVLCLFAWALGSTPRPLEAEDVRDELVAEQEDVKEVILQVSRRMVQLAQELEAEEPEEAKRLRDAARLLEEHQVPRSLDEIRSFLSDGAFIEALTRQDEVLVHMKEILALLENRLFEDPADAAELERIREEREAIARLASAQEKLLEKTRNARGRENDVRSLRELLDALRNLMD
ncbi:MAG TPA: hypothetical protein VK116_15935, partial [Planctomycetota bacterium]|nr:hypothetical protein [Planctomycetota bacterium]